MAKRSGVLRAQVYQTALETVGLSGIQTYAIDLGPVFRSGASVSLNTVPYASLDWPRAGSGRRQIPQAPGGRAHALPLTLDLATVYDALMENLRYVITYRPTPGPDVNGARGVRIQLIDLRTGAALRIVDASGRLVRSKVIVEDSYVPRGSPTEATADIANQQLTGVKESWFRTR